MPTLLRLTRYPFTRGIIIHNESVLCHTFELPYLDNHRNISSIPKGSYHVHKSTSSKFGSVLRFSSVINRTGILIHAGNTIKDTSGCILVGLDTSPTGIINSKSALNRLLACLPDSFTLNIQEY